MAVSELAAWRSPHDRVGINELLTHYAKPLQELSRQLQSSFASHPKSDPQILDDIFILRYLLSRKGDVPASVASIKQALDWRKQNLDLIKAATDLTKPPALAQESLQKLNCYMAGGIHTPTSYGDIVLIIRAACVNFQELVQDLDSVAIYMMYLWEVCFQYCDSESRRRGYIVKLFVVNDMNGFSPNPFIMKKFGAVMGSQSKRSEFLYPQFLGMMCAANAPSIINYIFKMISPMMSKGFADKFRVHGTVSPEPSRIAAKDLPLPFKGDDAAAMPSFLGGRCECEGGCVGFKVSNALPPPPRKTPDDLPLFASLTTFVQVRYLQRQREKAANDENAGSITMPETCQECRQVSYTTSPVSSGPVAKEVADSATSSNRIQEGSWILDELDNLIQVERAQEPKQTAYAGAADVQANVEQPSAVRSSSISRAPASPMKQNEIQIETEVDMPMLAHKGCLFCL